jgi:hypothetical protein
MVTEISSRNNYLKAIAINATHGDLLGQVGHVWAPRRDLGRRTGSGLGGAVCRGVCLESRECH